MAVNYATSAPLRLLSGASGWTSAAEYLVLGRRFKLLCESQTYRKGNPRLLSLEAIHRCFCDRRRRWVRKNIIHLLWPQFGIFIGHFWYIHCGPISRTISITTTVYMLSTQCKYVAASKKCSAMRCFCCCCHTVELSQKITFTFFGPWWCWPIHSTHMVVDRFPFKSTLKRTINRS